MTGGNSTPVEASGGHTTPRASMVDACTPGILKTYCRLCPPAHRGLGMRQMTMMQGGIQLGI